MSYKVLVLLKPTEEQPALERVAEFARFLPSLEVVVCRVVSDFSDDQIPTLKERYEREISSLMKRYPSIEHYETYITFSKNVPEAFCNYAKLKSKTLGMAVISANKRNTLRDMFISPLDSQIMSKINLPLLVVKDANAPQHLSRAIVLAIDFEENEHDKMVDEVLFAAANSFAEHFNGEVHVLNCVPPIHRGLMSGKTTESVILGTDKPITRADVHGRDLAVFAEQHGIPTSHCHIAEGRVDEMIPKVCRKLEARMVCMGMSTKDGVLSAIDQSASELVLEQIKGDIFIVNRNINIDDLRAQQESREAAAAES